jgi:uncharacterized protein (DUF1800 family)
MRVGSIHQAVRTRAALAAASVIVTTAWLVVACASSGLSNGRGAGSLSERDRAIHLLSRATYGVRQQDVTEVMRMGTKDWIDRQLNPREIADAGLEQRLALLSQPAQQVAGGRGGAAGATVRVGPLQEAVRARTAVRAQPPTRPLPPGRAQPPRPPQPNRDTVAAMRAMMVELVARVQVNALPQLVAAKLVRAVHSERQLEEVMTDFWFNHFNVYFNKGQVRQALADYEENAIRRHVFGRFEDMLVATAQHPAMLVYLDNFTSTAPTAAARPGQRPGGLNENYARELLELHTLGVDGGYTQQDVIEVARAFTGWGIASNATRSPLPAGGGGRGGRGGVGGVVGGGGGVGVRSAGGRGGGGAGDAATVVTQTVAPVEFRFQPERHDTGEKAVLGRTLPAGRGMEDGMDVLHMIAAHPSTAKHIATKLVRHFVADNPPPKLVDEIARVFRDTNGDLRAVTRALFTADEFYNAAHFRSKAKRPFEFVASALRVTDAEVRQSPTLVTQLRTFGHLPYSEPAPTGYPTVAKEWLSAGAMLARINFAMELAAGRVNGVQLDPAIQSVNGTAEESTAVTPATETPALLLSRFLPGVAADQLRVAIAEDLATQTAANPRTAMARAIGLALGSPEFQRY